MEPVILLGHSCCITHHSKIWWLHTTLFAPRCCGSGLWGKEHLSSSLLQSDVGQALKFNGCVLARDTNMRPPHHGGPGKLACYIYYLHPFHYLSFKQPASWVTITSDLSSSLSLVPQPLQSFSPTGTSDPWRLPPFPLCPHPCPLPVKACEHHYSHALHPFPRCPCSVPLGLFPSRGMWLQHGSHHGHWSHLTYMTAGLNGVFSAA